jgi:hypothetical protein
MAPKVAVDEATMDEYESGTAASLLMIDPGTIA